MRFRKLRIAWSVIWGVAAVLLIVLWMRSYWIVEKVVCKAGESLLYVGSQPGVFGFSILSEAAVEPWIVFKQPSDEWRETGGDLWLQRSWGGFYIDDETIMAPYWIWCLVPATLAVAPWLKWSNHFSLRTLLIATTLVAVVLGLIVWLR